MKKEFSKWVACWGNATSISDRREANYAKDITLRYPVKMCFNGNKLRLHFSNFTGTEGITISKCYVAKVVDEAENYCPVCVTFDSNTAGEILPGAEIVSDVVALDINRGETIEVSLYFENFTQMNAGTLITGPLSGGKYSYGNFTELRNLPVEKTRNTNWYYFLNTIDIYTEEKNFALICYGDSITAQAWPDFLSLRAEEEKFENVAIIRRAVSGTRILRQYDCLNYAAYGLKGEIRFPVEMNVAGAKSVIIQHGINDIIHPVGVEENIFRPWSDLPSAQDLIDAVKNIYVDYANKLGLKVYCGTLLPIYGWRTYEEFREEIRAKFNDWLRNSDCFEACIDFDKALRSKENPKAFLEEYDSGDHLHPSLKAYKLMAQTVPSELLV